jgi:hypothetical protein
MSQTAVAAAPTDACALLSQQEIATVLGVNVDPGEHKISPGDCRWTERGKSVADGAVLQVNLTEAQAFKIGKIPLPVWIKTRETGLADDAYFVDSGKVNFPVSPSLSVNRGPVFFVITAKIPKASLEQTKAVEKTLALKVLGNL